jgi:molybdenum cofactor cytidylyltransferase
MPRERTTGAIAGLVLAAGSSTRMGENKLLLRLGEESVLRRAVRRASEAGLDPVLVVLGHDADRAREELAGLSCRSVVNPGWSLGKSTSVRAGVAAVPPEAVAAIVILADMPLVTAGMLSELVRTYRRGATRLVASRYGDVHAPPVLYDRTLFGELAAMEGDGCGKQIVKRHGAEAAILSWPPAVLADLDVPSDYARIQAALEER